MAPRGMVIEVPDDEDGLTVTDTNEQPRRRGSGDDRHPDNTAGFAELRSQLEQVTKTSDDNARRAQEERRARQQADARAQKAEEDAKIARNEGVEGRRIAIDNSLNAITTAIDAIESEMAAALEAGDFKKHAALSRRLQSAIVDQKNLEAGKVALGAEPDPAKDTEKPVRQESKKKPETDEERFEAYIQQFSPAVQEWIREHPEVATNQAQNARAIAAHHDAIAAGHKTDSDSYFAYLDRKLGFRSSAAARDIRRDNPIDRDNDDDEPPRRNATVRSAPVRGGGASGGRSSQVELTEGEVANATDGTIVWNLGQVDRTGKVITEKDSRLGEPIGLEEMARRKRNMHREGRYAVPTL